jgi:hypothetical protein
MCAMRSDVGGCRGGEAVSPRLRLKRKKSVRHVGQADAVLLQHDDCIAAGIAPGAGAFHVGQHRRGYWQPLSSIHRRTEAWSTHRAAAEQQADDGHASEPEHEHNCCMRFIEAADRSVKQGAWSRNDFLRAGIFFSRW